MFDGFLSMICQLYCISCKRLESIFDMQSKWKGSIPIGKLALPLLRCYVS